MGNIFDAFALGAFNSLVHALKDLFHFVQIFPSEWSPEIKSFGLGLRVAAFAHNLKLAPGYRAVKSVSIVHWPNRVTVKLALPWLVQAQYSVRR